MWLILSYPLIMKMWPHDIQYKFVCINLINTDILSSEREKERLSLVRRKVERGTDGETGREREREREG